MENQLILARKLQNVYDNRPDPRDFIGAMADNPKSVEKYTEESIKKDEDYVSSTRNKIDEQNSSNGLYDLERKEGGFALSEMLQAMVVDQLNKGWLDEFKAVMTSDFDDLKVGADAVLKHTTGQYLAASFDFTITHQEKNIYNKLSTVWERNVESGSIPTIKYFEDPDTHEKREISAPKFIIGASRQDVEEMAKCYIENKEDALKDHKFQYMIIEQMYEQLVSVRDYYDHHQDDPRLEYSRRQYGKVYDTVQRIRDKFQREGKINNVDFYEYSKESPALATMRNFKIAKESH
ncbi:hypothetical protein K8Q96_00010 [Candidatus Nomurabacteria bacterium]|nr:hypothetical protein [Candidatus Nomurabacteria bacterium]